MNMRVVLYFLGRISMALSLALGLTAALSVVCGDWPEPLWSVWLPV